jgi:FAD/FMN-containing dehydrogenase
MVNVDELKKLVEGEVDTTDAALTTASHDASLFEVRPEVVVSPKNVEDVKKLVRYVSLHPGLNLAARSAGTDMSGGPLTESIVVDFLKHFDHIKEVKEESQGNLGDDFSHVLISGYAVTEPGVYYRDFDKATLEKGGQIMPSYPASRELCTMGGIAANNSGGEKTLTYGKTERYVRRLKMVCADGEEHEFKPISMKELEGKERGHDFGADVYRQMHKLIGANKDLLDKAKPIVSKNSCGYYLWNVIKPRPEVESSETLAVEEDFAEGQGATGGRSFDLCKMIVGSQGTLGMITEIEYVLVKPKKYSHLLVVFLTDLNQLGETATHILEHKPESFESYDDQTLKVAIKFLPQLMKQMGGNLVTLGLEFMPEMLAVLEGGLPKLVLMAEFTADTDEAALTAAMSARDSLKSLHERMRVTKTENDEHKYWVIRRESFNMLRKHIHGVRTAPFIDDFVVPPKTLPEFLPKLYAILEPYKKDLTYTIAGHVGDGNFHIIPLMNLNEHERTLQIIKDLSVKVYELVHEFHGSITGEHNDGIIRTPFVKMQYGEEVYRLFEEVKKIWDPKGIFNPGKKVGGTLEYAFEHIVKTS